MEERLVKLPPFVRKIAIRQDNLLALLVVWFLGLTIFPTGAFYLGTICSPAGDMHVDHYFESQTLVRHFTDLRTADIHYGGYFALGGLALGVCFGLWATFVYPNLKQVDEQEDAVVRARLEALKGHHHEPHADDAHPGASI